MTYPEQYSNAQKAPDRILEALKIACEEIAEDLGVDPAGNDPVSVCWEDAAQEFYGHVAVSLHLDGIEMQGREGERVVYVPNADNKLDREVTGPRVVRCTVRVEALSHNVQASMLATDIRGRCNHEDVDAELLLANLNTADLGDVQPVDASYDGRVLSVAVFEWTLNWATSHSPGKPLDWIETCEDPTNVAP
jgi:hypothetical protein